MGKSQKRKNILEKINIDFLISEPQHEFLTSTEPSTGFVAGLGSGKSMIASLKVILFKLKYPSVKAAYYLPTFPLIKDIAFEKFPELLEKIGLKYILNKSDKEIKIHKFGKIIFRTMSEPESIIGYDVGYSVIDETDILSLEKMTIAYENITARNRTKLPDRSKNIVDVVGTPEGFKWFYNNFKKNPFKGSKLVRASTYSNIHNLPDDYIDKLSALFPPNRLKAYLSGEFTNLASGTVYSYFKREQHHTDEEIKQGEPLHIGQDFNVGGCCSTINVIRHGIPMQLDEVTSHDTREVIINLKDRYPGYNITIYPDASGDNQSTNASESDIALLREAGFRINAPSANGRITNRVNSFNVKLSNNEFKINTNKCPNSTDALEQQVYDKNGTPEKFGGAATIDDWNDAQGYFIVRKFGITKNTMTVSNVKYT